MQDFVDTDQDTIVKVLADVLQALCATNDHLPPPQNVNKFHAADVPGISIHDYLLRIKKYAQCSTQCFVLALIYIDKLIQGQHGFVICSLNVHRIVITTIMLAAKFFDDCYYNNRYYARIGGVDAQEMNQLEVEFLFMTNFQLGVTPETYTQYFKQLCDHIAHTNNPSAIPEIPPPQYPDQPLPPNKPNPAEFNNNDQHRFDAACERYAKDVQQFEAKTAHWHTQCAKIDQEYNDACQQRIAQNQQQPQGNKQPHIIAHQQQLEQQIAAIDDLKRGFFEQPAVTTPSLPVVANGLDDAEMTH